MHQRTGLVGCVVAMTTVRLLTLVSTVVFVLSCGPRVGCLTGFSSTAAASGVAEYCQAEIFTAGCASDEVIVIRSAFYGRMRMGRCVKANSGHVGCRVNVLRQADRLCSGRRACRIQVSARSFGPLIQSCATEARSYFEVSYECKKVITVVSPECNIHKFVTVRSRSGLLSNVVAEEKGQGSLACPWRIELPRGERINVTLIDFSTPMADLVGENRICYQYALVTEKLSTTENRRVCGGERREQSAYTSRTNTIEIRIITKKNVETDRNVYFLLKYEAIGCPIPETPKNGWMVRDSEGILMGCNLTTKTWRLYCDGNQWTSQTENCSTNERYDKSIMTWKHVAVPQSVVLIVIGSLVVITVIVIAILSLLCIEWRKGKTQRRMRRLSVPASREAQISPPSGKPSQSHHNSRGSRTRYDSLKASAPNCSSVGEPPDAVQRTSGAKENDYYTPEERLSPRHSPSSNDYLREMWPMALPPGNVAGTTLFKDAAEHTDASPFQYGDSVTLTTTASTHAHSPRGVAEATNDYDTHIYETPKYLRREKAATLRLKGVKTQCFESDSVKPDSESSLSKTLPRELSSNSRRS